MKLTFKQFTQLSNLTEDQITEEKLEEIFGVFFGGKSPLDKTKLMAAAKVQASKDALNKKPAPKVKKIGANKPAVVDFGHDVKEAQELLEKGIEIPYKGYKFNKVDTGKYTVTKGSYTVGTARDHQEAMKLADKHKAAPYQDYKIVKKADSGMFHITKHGRLVGHARSPEEVKKTIEKDQMPAD